jgi:ATP-dependent Clp protease ATP-binding subunit ClpA
VDMPLDPESVSILHRAGEEMQGRGHKELDLEHLFLAILYVPSKAKEILGRQGITYKQVSGRIPAEPRDGLADYT